MALLIKYYVFLHRVILFQNGILVVRKSEMALEEREQEKELM